MKKIILFLTVIFAVAFNFVTVEASSSEAKFDNLYYKVVTLNNGSKEVHITGHDLSTQHIVIPEKIKTYPVTAIAENAFFTSYSDYWSEMDFSAEDNEAYQASKIQSVLLPKTLKVIEKGAFSSNHLTKLVLPNSVVSIAAMAFYHNDLTDVTFSTNVTTIGDGAFMANDLTKVSLPNKLKEIGRDAFSQNKIDNLTIPSSVTYIRGNIAVDNPLKTVKLPTHLQIKKDKKHGDLFYTIVKNKGKNEIVITGYNMKSKATKITVPSAINKIPVTEIGPFAFAPHITPVGQNRVDVISLSVKQVVLPNSIRKIGDSAFEGTAIKVDKLPTSLVTIGHHAFDYSGTGDPKSLKTLTLPSKVQTIGDGAFGNNGVKGTLTLPAAVITIGKAVFSDNKITTLTIKAKLKEIPSFAFYANNISSLTLPKSLETVGESAFSMNALPRLVLPDNVQTIEAYAFAYNKINSVTLQNKVALVKSGAFYNNRITTITVPASVRYFALNSVSNINIAPENKLKSVTFKGKNTIISEPIFEKVYTNKEKTIEFTNWDKVQTKPITLYID